MCLTPEKCLGGRAWPNVIPHKDGHEIPLLLWGNSTLGLLMHWWKGARQQQGRSITTITAIPDLPVLDPRALTEDQMKHCRGIFTAASRVGSSCPRMRPTTTTRAKNWTANCCSARPAC